MRTIYAAENRRLKNIETAQKYDHSGVESKRAGELGRTGKQWRKQCRKAQNRKLGRNGEQWRGVNLLGGKSAHLYTL